jgi:ABC-type thiamine transport system ATPase subunit
VLIIGPSGSGKSTLTVQLAAAGWSFLTDDVLLLADQGEHLEAWPLRRSFAITAETFAASNFLQKRTALNYQNGQRDDKKQFAPHAVFGSDFKENCVPRTLFFPALTGADRSEAVALSRGETMARLIRMNPWSCYDRTTAADHLASLSTLAKQTEAYSLLAGRDLLDPDTAAGILAKFTRN